MRQCVQRMGNQRDCLVSAICYNADGSLTLLVSQACGLETERDEQVEEMYWRKGIPLCMTRHLQDVDSEASRVLQKRKLARQEADEFRIYRNVRIRLEESPIASSSVVPSGEPHTKAEMRKCKFCMLCFLNDEDRRDHEEEERTCCQSLDPSHSIYHKKSCNNDRSLQMYLSLQCAIWKG
jgi:hypothetical protein